MKAKSGLHSSHGQRITYSNPSNEPNYGLIEVAHPKCGDLPSHITQCRVAVLGQNTLSDIVKILADLQLLKEAQPTRASAAEAATCCLTGIVPAPDTYTANVIEGLAHRIHERRQREARYE